MLNAYVFNLQEVFKDCPTLKEILERESCPYDWTIPSLKRLFIFTEEKFNLVQFLGYDDNLHAYLLCGLKEGRDDYILKQIIEELVKARKKFGENVISIFNACLKEEKASEIDLNSCNCDTTSNRTWYNTVTADAYYTTTTGSPLNWSDMATIDSTSYVINGGGEYTVQIPADKITFDCEGKHTLKDALDDLRKCCDENTETFKNFEKQIKNNLDKEGEESNMFENLNFEFGPVNKNRIQMSPFGMAVSVGSNSKGTRKWYSYDSKNHKLIDVQGFAFDLGMDMYYKVPVSPNAIHINDVIIQNDELFFVTGFVNVANPQEGFTAINVAKSKVETVLPICNVFNFNFVTKVVPLFNLFGGNGTPTDTMPSEDAPFGNLMPLMFMSQMKDGENSSLNKMFEMYAMASMFGNGANPFGAMMGGNA